MHACAIRFDLHIGSSRSLKEKRRVLRPLVDSLGQRPWVSVAEVDHQDLHQRAALGVALVAPTAHRLAELIDTVQRVVDSAADVELIQSERAWLEPDDQLLEECP